MKTENANAEPNAGHWHEFIDRAYVLNESVDCFLMDHPCGKYLGPEINAAHDALCAVYQRAAELADKMEAP